MHGRAHVLFGMSVVFKFAHLFDIKGSICQLPIADQQSTTETNPQNRRAFFSKPRYMAGNQLFVVLTSLRAFHPG